MHFVIRLLLENDFKAMVNWMSLNVEDITLSDHLLEEAPLRSYIILTAVKI